MAEMPISAFRAGVHQDPLGRVLLVPGCITTDPPYLLWHGWLRGHPPCATFAVRAPRPRRRGCGDLALSGSRTGGNRGRARAGSRGCSPGGVVMTDPARDGSFVSKDNSGNTLYNKDFWSKENLKYSRSHYRLEKS